MGAITVGDSPIDRANYGNQGKTELTLGNPANLAGTITLVSVYVYTAITGLYVGIFYATTGNNYKCRSAASLGNCGTKLQTFAVSLAVQPGDVIGYFLTSGRIDKSNSGYTGLVLADDTNNHCVVDDEFLTATYDGYALSLQGTGTSKASRGWWK